MNVIHKVQLNVNKNYIDMPIGAEILGVHSQRDIIVLWYMFEYGEERTITRLLHVKMTGIAFSEKCTDIFLGTVLVNGGNFVAHVFEEMT